MSQAKQQGAQETRVRIPTTVKNTNLVNTVQSFFWALSGPSAHQEILWCHEIYKTYDSMLS